VRVIESDAHSMTLEVWRIDMWSGTEMNRSRDEHDRIGWFTPDEVSRLVLADEEYRPLLAEDRGRELGLRRRYRWVPAAVGPHRP
jgi:hypothetical protein